MTQEHRQITKAQLGMFKLATRIGLPAIALAVAHQHTDMLGRDLEVRTNSGTLTVPVYSLNELRPANMCSAYARMAADEMFGMHYAHADAWDRIYTDDLVARVGNFDATQGLIEAGELLPGYMLGVTRDESPFATGVDQEGHEREYTHIALYIGQDAQSNPLFAHRAGRKTRVEDSESLRRKGYQPKVILRPKSVTQ